MALTKAQTEEAIATLSGDAASRKSMRELLDHRDAAEAPSTPAKYAHLPPGLAKAAVENDKRLSARNSHIIMPEGSEPGPGLAKLQADHQQKSADKYAFVKMPANTGAMPTGLQKVAEEVNQGRAA